MSVDIYIHISNDIHIAELYIVIYTWMHIHAVGSLNNYKYSIIFLPTL